MRVVFMGTPNFSVPILEALIKEYEVVLVVTQPDKETGRKKILTPSPIKEVALKNNIEVFQPIKIREDYQKIIDSKPDIIITAAYGQIIPKNILDYPKYKCINVHASLLPKYRGGAPIHWAIINGEEYAGVTIMYMAEKMDAGDIITQDKLLIKEMNTTELTNELSILGRDLLLKTIPLIISNKINPIKQNDSEVTFAYNISKEDEKINFNNDCIKVYNQIRGLSLIPGGYFIYNDKKVKIYSSTYEIKEIDAKIGEVVDTNKCLGIKVKNGVIYPLTIQLEGKNKMSIKDFYNGSANYFKLGDIVK